MSGQKQEAPGPGLPLSCGEPEEVVRGVGRGVLSPHSPPPPRPASLVVADFGCGDCKIASSIRNKVHSFDLVPLSPLVTVCDMAKVGGPGSTEGMG